MYVITLFSCLPTGVGTVTDIQGDEGGVGPCNILAKETRDGGDLSLRQASKTETNAAKQSDSKVRSYA